MDGANTALQTTSNWLRFLAVNGDRWDSNTQAESSPSLCLDAEILEGRCGAAAVETSGESHGRKQARRSALAFEPQELHAWLAL